MGKSNDDMSKLNTIIAFILMKIPYFWSGEVMVTTRCSSNCRFCVYADVKKEDMPKKTIEKGLDLFKKLKINRVLITGGEPFQAYDNLKFCFKKTLEFVPPKNIFLITSSNWAITEKNVEEKIDPLIKMGLENLSMSIDAFHMENVNTNNYFNILDFLEKTDVTPIILVRYNCKIKNHLDVFERIKNEYDVKLLTDIIVKTGGAARLSEEDIKAETKSFNSFRKRYESVDSKYYFFLKNPINSIFKSFVRTTCVYPTLFPNGDLHLCCRKNEDTKICNVLTDNFYEYLKKFNTNWSSNIHRIISQPLKCDKCPIHKD